MLAYFRMSVKNLTQMQPLFFSFHFMSHRLISHVLDFLYKT